MPGIVVCGGGVCGLVTSLLLAKDGHQVTVLERDPSAPPPPEDAWDAWERRGVNQFRLPHFVMPRFRYEMAKEAPELVDALVAAGARLRRVEPQKATLEQLYFAIRRSDGSRS